MDNINTNLLFSDIIIFLTYCLSIGLAEELSVRGFLQSHIINYIGTNSKNIVLSVFLSSLFFGIVHLINFDKGIYGEVSQVFYATFIGLLFGILLIITKRIYPLIIIHIIIDFVAGLDEIGAPFKEKTIDILSIENSILIILLALPCLIYGIFLLIKFKPLYRIH